MSRRCLNINYKESQIIKHSLQMSIRNKSVMKDFYSEKEIREEEKALERVKKFVEEYKEIINK